ncbi:MAG: sulfite exporter TauE/SafE family protein [Burkholderiaceae bacterium]|nr:sulfite exporter TauE/SafE family protein [Burkholderiaceae bacterium]
MTFDFSLLPLSLLGLVSGFLAGLLGIGGGMVLTPFLVLILTTHGVEAGLAVKMAIATSMGTIAFTSISSVRAHHQRGAVRWRIVWRLAPGIWVGAMAASMGAFALLRGAWLALVFALFVGFSATQMFLDRKPSAARQLPALPGLFGAGGGIGFLSGMVGAGGGFVSVPFLAWCNVPIHSAIATSAALGFPIAVSNVIGYVISGWGHAGLPPHSAGYVWLPALAAIAVCSVLTAPLGAKAAHALPVKPLKRIFACLLYLLAAYMLYQGLQGF